MKTLETKLPVFISSTITECASERQAAREAVRSINHSAVLFEDIGARPHPPRSIYVRGLQESRIFVGIYRESYGWIAPDMKISGIEDELRTAQLVGLPRLLYELKDAGARHPRLTRLLDEVKERGGVTVAFFRSADELLERIRDDLTATITERFSTSAPEDLARNPPAADQLRRLQERAAPLILRSDLAERIESQVKQSGIVAVCGVTGIGKSVALAQTSARLGWTLVDAEGMLPAEMLRACATAVASPGAPTASTTADAEEQFLVSWRRARSTTLVVDGATNVDDLLRLAALAGTEGTRRLVLAVPMAPVGIPTVEVITWSREEVEAFLVALGRETSTSDTNRLVSASEGNPLYLRFWSLVPDNSHGDLESFERSRLASLDSNAKELVTFLALSRTALGVAPLSQLMAQAPARILSAAASAGGLLRETDRGYRLVHSHLGQTVRTDLKRTPAGAAFYAERVSRWFQDQGDVTMAYFALADIDHPDSQRLLPEAALAATARGEVLVAYQLNERRLTLAREALDVPSCLEALLGLAMLSAQRGVTAEAQRWLAEASAEAAAVADPSWRLRVKEVATQVDITFGGSADALTSLGQLRAAYETADDRYGVARVDFHLSTVFIQTKRFQEALDASDRALTAFEKLGHDYGRDAALTNRASALSSFPGREAEADAIVAVLLTGSARGERRLRALRCNLLTRRHREAGDTGQARKFAHEAIEIAKELGDSHLLLVNRINLGNTYRDDGARDSPAYELALREYESVREEAAGMGFRSVEAHAMRMVADVRVRQEKFALALKAADIAIEIAAQTVDGIELSEGYRQRGMALRGMRQYSEAAIAFARAAMALRRANGSSKDFFDFFRRALLVGSSDGSELTTASLDEIALLLNEGYVASSHGSLRERVDAVLRSYLASVAGMPPEEGFSTTVSIFDRVLATCPSFLAEIYGRQAGDILVRSTTASSARTSLSALVGLLAARAGAETSLERLVHLVESLPELPGAHFRPLADGGAHWTLRLNLGRPVICTVTQTDASSAGFFVTLVVASLCAAFQEQLRPTVLSGAQFAQAEVAFFVAPAESVADLGAHTEFEGPFAVTRSTEPKEPRAIGVLFKETEIAALRAGGQGFAVVRTLAGWALQELVFHLLGGEVDLDSLRPKVTDLIDDVF